MGDRASGQGSRQAAAVSNVHAAIGVRLPQPGQPMLQRRVSVSRAQRGVQSPAERAQLQLAVNLQRPVPIILPLRLDHAILCLCLPVQIAQGHIAIPRMHDGMPPLHLRLQLQRPATLQDGVPDGQLYLTTRLSQRQVDGSRPPSKVGTHACPAPFEALVRQALHLAGKVE